MVGAEIVHDVGDGRQSPAAAAAVDRVLEHRIESAAAKVPEHLVGQRRQREPGDPGWGMESGTEHLRAEQQRSVRQPACLGHRGGGRVHPGYDQVRAARRGVHLREREVDLLTQAIHERPDQPRGAHDQIAVASDPGLDVEADRVKLEPVATHPVRERGGRADDHLVPVGAQPHPESHQRLDIAPGAERREQDSHGTGSVRSGMG